jgi:hypothetical protein
MSRRLDSFREFVQHRWVRSEASESIFSDPGTRYTQREGRGAITSEQSRFSVSTGPTVGRGMLKV